MREYNVSEMICRCNHSHQSHKQIQSVNYSAGHCNECDCLAFLIADGRPPLRNVVKAIDEQEADRIERDSVYYQGWQGDTIRRLCATLRGIRVKKDILINTLEKIIQEKQREASESPDAIRGTISNSIGTLQYVVRFLYDIEE